MKVKIFQSISEKKVERRVNEFLQQSGIEIVSIQYGATAFYFSIMVFYKEAVA